MVAISGSWALRIFAARAFTSGFEAWVAARSAMSTACWWWGIMSVANCTSVALKATETVGDAPADAVILGVAS
ncbi:hypothetical protein [Dactylosporangium sp. NPDC006015]|uniref:hypothetical protein n=1 Tax=Dactylosporangium sp. NPDC006015 TaxID=3154576 RepID=UPI0033A87505